MFGFFLNKSSIGKVRLLEREGKQLVMAHEVLTASAHHSGAKFE
jgi:hypothetical protein